MKNLFGEEIHLLSRRPKKEAVFNNYDGFVEKFKPKKTTDDCYTPQIVYDAICEWVNNNILPLDGVNVVRPFYPGGDYEHFDYPEDCIVLDNPPFSILGKIRRFYHDKGIKYFLFVPALTCAYSARELDATYLICGAGITYENGAIVSTSFITNLSCGDVRIWCAGGLTKAIEKANADNLKTTVKPSLPKYDYPANVVTPAIIQRISQRGVDFRIGKAECISVTQLDSQRESKKTLFGGGWLISDRAAAERAAAERAAVLERKYWTLSERERKVIENLK